MNFLNLILDNYLNGKATFGPIRRILDMIFSASIASFLFKRFYFNYQFLDITDYKGIFEFFLDGRFFIPLALFAFVHYGLYLISSIFFILTTTRQSRKWVQSIIRAKVTKKDITGTRKQLKKHAITRNYINLTPSWIADTYKILKESITQEQWKNAETMVKQTSQNVERNFQLNIKVLVTISIYFFFTAPYFGVILYILSTIALLATMIFFWYSYLVLDVLPTLVRKIDYELQQIVKQQELPDQAEKNL